jgi:tetratricopeptide (TPR) repeat protein
MFFALAIAAVVGLEPTTMPASLDLERMGRDHLYNLEYEQARDQFGELSRRFPESPAGPYFEATAMWMEEFSRRGGMAGATFRSGDYWARTRHEAPDPEHARGFRERVNEAVRRAEAILAKEPRDRDALFFRGAADGVLAAYVASVEHRYYSSYQTAKRAKSFHERLSALDPDYADAYLLQGIYEYTVATLPRSLRILGFVVGIRGEKERGRKLVELSARKGNRTRWVARLSAAVIAQREKRYASALAALRQAERAFPRNPLFVLEQGSVHLLRKDWGRARALFERVLRQQSNEVPNYAALHRAIVLLKIGESELFAKRFIAASDSLNLALSEPDVPDYVRARIFLRRGMSSDGRGRRSEAKWDYRRALSLDADSVTNKLARTYSKIPFR